ncbi:snoRNA-binding rRNA-processing protein NOP14 [Lachancea thermotolerans CBS 6340]|uniref:KLTH0H01782p n=1 Tax=Lachancea thermotolerans (strain ATCC 56472 / CBS 6340 / NRRL Y-8284) TaxID=559295 RepID=C5E233_LACTC|nr:KLTH0H01782p [Lachancea thermotolerans CBS 6340]CAR30094.1 KLTH0H01782p [Lachancea thermotolerans CBS 6340]
MAGSQLKNLKNALKEQGFTGQTNVKGSKKLKRKAKEYDRDERTKAIARIREQFNPFDVKMNRDKRGAEAKRVAQPVGKPGISKQIGEEQRKQVYEAKKKSKNRLGGLLDRRFGENFKGLTEEEKMLERFTREKQSQASSRRSLFNLDDDDDAGDDDVYGEKLTHYGKSLSFQDDFQEDDLGLDEDTGNKGSSKRSEREFGDENAELPARKKTKAEVMKEVIAKSKFYKQERQKAQEKLEDDIQDVDDEFEDVMAELNSLPKAKKTDQNNSKEFDKEYDTKVRELGLDRRAAPAERTKTEEELEKENEEKRQKLEQARLDRMRGMFGEEEDQGVEDLGEEFWAGEDSENEDLNETDGSELEDVELPGGDETKSFGGKSKAVSVIPCPQTEEELKDFLQSYELREHPNMVKEIIRTYQPSLAMGNKGKLGVFTGVLLRHILSLSVSYDDSHLELFGSVQNSLIAILRSMAQKYNEPLSETCREITSEIQERFKNERSHGLSTADLIFFTLVGYIFSTSDHYHLVVTPCNVLIGELLEQTKLNSFQNVFFCAVLARISLSYQNMGKRLVPELVYFFEKSLVTLLPLTSKEKSSSGLAHIIQDSEDLNAPQKLDLAAIGSHNLNLRQAMSQDYVPNDQEKSALLCNILASLEEAISLVWKELSSFQELTLSFKRILSAFSQIYEDFEKPKVILEKIEKFEKFHEHFPLSLQNHRPVSIPSHVPKYEENFNPDKKSYDPDRTRNEVNKMKAQLKKERKFTMKEIRKDTRFEARQQIETKKKDYADYHSKMARIINQISTEEGMEKGKYEREKKLRNSKK